MAEMLVQNFDNWLEKLDPPGIDAYKEKAADAYITWRDAKIALTSDKITNILRPMNAEARVKWTTRHNEVLNMTLQDIDIACDEARARFQTKYDARSVKGDIVEIQEDGFWTVIGRDWDTAHFDLVVVPGLSVKEARQKYGGPLYDGAEMKHKFKANIVTSVDVNKKQELAKTTFELQVLIKV